MPLGVPEPRWQDLLAVIASIDRPLCGGANQGRLAQPSVASSEERCNSLDPAVDGPAAGQEPLHQRCLQPVVRCEPAWGFGQVGSAEQRHHTTNNSNEAVRANSVTA